MKKRNINFFLKINVVINLKTLIICPPVFLNKQHENSRCVIFIHRALPCENCLCYSEFLFSQITLRQLKVDADQYPNCYREKPVSVEEISVFFPLSFYFFCKQDQISFLYREIAEAINWLSPREPLITELSPGVILLFQKRSSNAIYCSIVKSGYKKTSIQAFCYHRWLEIKINLYQIYSRINI